MRRKFRQRRHHSNYRNQYNRYQSHNADEKSLEIPGFYFDPIKKRYFNIPTHPSSQDQLKLKLDVEKPVKVLKVDGNYLNLLNRRQLSLDSSTSFVNRFLRLKISRMRSFYNIELNESDTEYPVFECKYLIGCPESSTFVAACTLQTGGVLVRSFSLESKNEDCNDMHVEFQNTCGINFCEKVTDLCILDVAEDKKYVLFTSVDVSPHPRHCSSVTVHALTHLNSYPQMCGVYEHEQHREEKPLLWSCTWNKHTQTFAIGGEHLIRAINLNGGVCNIPFKENCFSLTYNLFGNQLFVGSNIGNLSCFDLRSAKFISSEKLGKGISYIKLLKNENFIITSGFEGKLLQVDLRTWKPVLEYPEHVNDYLKLPFSIDEEANVLCSVGQDRNTRLWSLNEGKLLHSIRPDYPVLSVSDQPMAWYSASWQLSPQKSESCLVMTTQNAILLYK
ncbi:DDB1- and CUL4-associated factor 4-like [Centruroides sculpturatus]|uniref:DDB1- and CUL4-associated factor 4-like n=1 Tax=Centruroides sculpturatus TaxID=218467 RepID=UPI000C6CB5FB|nr:DDB1- and CUL4-associated factor 4-like [Centruroides sculpturatus]